MSVLQNVDFFSSLLVSSSREFILLRKNKIYLFGIYRGTVLIQSFLFCCYRQQCCDIDYYSEVCSSCTCKILQDINLCLHKSFIFINKRGGRQEVFLVLHKVFMNMLSENVIFTTFPIFVCVFFSSKCTALLGSEGTYFQWIM